MDLPRELALWDLAFVRRLVDSADYEPGWFDFKAVMTGPGSIVDSVRRVACAMANTDGGFLVFGVKDRAARKADEDPLVGLPISAKADLRKEFGDLAQAIRRPIRFDCSPKAIPVESDGSRGLFIVQIPRSLMSPHEVDGKFWRRGDQGACKAMEFYEVRDQMMVTEERFSKLTLLRIQLAQLQSLCNTIARADLRTCSFRFETGAINPLIAETCTLFPPGNQLLRDLGAMVTRARQCNELLEKLNHEALISPRGVAPGIKDEWVKDFEVSRFAVEDVCRRTEEALSEVYGRVNS
jgi:hypothetical protein